MLSFLHEDGNNDSGKQVQQPSVQNNTNNQAPAAADPAQQEFLMPANTGKKVKQSTLILVVLLAVGAAAVFFMIKQTVPRDASAEDSSQEIQIESAIAKLSGIRTEMYGKLDQIEASRLRALGRGHERGDDRIHVAPIHLARHRPVRWRLRES